VSVLVPFRFSSPCGGVSPVVPIQFLSRGLGICPRFIGGHTQLFVVLCSQGRAAGREFRDGSAIKPVQSFEFSQPPGAFRAFHRAFMIPGWVSVPLVSLFFSIRSAQMSRVI
jgi:hypothetical protein